MGFGLKLTDGSNTLYDFFGTGRYIDGLNGWQRGQSTDDDTVIDTLTNMVQDVAADIQADASTINRILELAEIYDEEQIGTQIFLEGSLDGTNWRRSPVVGGSVVNYDMDSAIRAGFSHITVQVERKDYFDGAEITLGLTNPNGTDVTTGLRIYNTNDGAVVDTSYHRHNYVEIDGDDVAGDLPCPVKLTISAESTINRVYIGCGWANTQTLDPCIEAEDTYGGTADSNCSGGYYQAIADNWVSILSGGTTLVNWYLPILRAHLNNANAKLRFWINNGQPREVYLSHDVSGTGSFQLFQLPVVRAPAEGPSMGITFYWDYAASQDTDFVMLLPANFWRIAERVANEPAATQYVENAYTERYGFIYSIERPTIAYGPGIFLMPAKDQRIWMLYQHINTTTPITDADISMHATVTLTYRPRYRSL